MTQGIRQVIVGADYKANNKGWWGDHLPVADLFAAYFYGTLEPAFPSDPTYDYSHNDRTLIASGAVVTPLALSSGVNSFLDAPFTSADLAARTGAFTAISFQKAPANVLSAGCANYGSTNSANFASFLVGMVTGTGTPYEAQQRNISNAQSTIKLNSDANTGQVYEMLAATFSRTAVPTLYRRCIAVDGVTQIRQTVTGTIANIDCAGPSLVRMGRTLADTFAGPVSVLGNAFYDRALSFSDMDAVYAAAKTFFANPNFLNIVI